jgi:DNA-binding XRE family transcriptional regulator
MTIKLLDYLNTLGIGHNFFAKKVKTSPATLSRILKQQQLPSIETAIAIDKETKGEVSVYDWSLEAKQHNDACNQTGDKNNRHHNKKNHPKF